MLMLEKLTEVVVGAAIEVHRLLGPGLLEPAYAMCLAREFEIRGIKFRKEVDLPVEYKGMKLDCGYRMDLVVEESVVVEIKAVEKLVPVHEAQRLTHVRLSGHRVGLLFNFNAAVLRNAMIRRVL